MRTYLTFGNMEVKLDVLRVEALATCTTHW
jgi:hypothetical protein